MIGFISGDDESAYRDEIKKLAMWYSDNNLSLNTTKTKELILDYRWRSVDLAPLHISGVCVEKVHTFKLLVIESPHIRLTLLVCQHLSNSQEGTATFLSMKNVSLKLTTNCQKWVDEMRNLVFLCLCSLLKQRETVVAASDRDRKWMRTRG